MTTLCITVDHEVPSVGGDLACCALRPAERIAARCAAFDAPVTWFPDALALGGSIEVKRQLSNFALQGHELGVHVHPEHREAATTCVSARELDRWTAECVAWLVDLGVRPTAIRAGAWSVPTEGWGRLMTRHDLSVDSSILPGRWLRGRYDFRGSSGDAWWPFQSNPMYRQRDADLLELPVTTGWLGRRRDLAGLTRVRGGAPGCGEGSRRRSAGFARLMALGTGVLDPCAQPPGNLRRLLEQEGRDLFVAVVHTQRYSEAADFGLLALLEHARQRNWAFATLTEAARLCR